MSRQLELPFNISDGCEPYYCKYTGTYGEICKGGLVFNIREKMDCRVCAKMCCGCSEMRINFGFVPFDDLKHLVQRPHLLSPKYRRMFDEYRGTDEAKRALCMA